MKKSELTTFIKEEILSTLNESPSSEEVRMAKQAVSRFMKYRNVKQDEAIRDLKNALDVLKSSMEEATIETSPEDLAKVKQTADKDDVIKVTEDYSVFKNYDDIIGGIQVRFGALEDYVQDKEPGAMDDLQKVMRAFEIFDEKMAYGAHMELEEDEDAPAGDDEVEKKATKQDQIIKNYQNLQKELKKHLEMYKDAEGDEAKNAALKMMKKISQSAEYLDAKAKYEKLKKIK